MELVWREVGKTLLTELGHQAVTSLFSFENKNLLPAGPQTMATGSPRIRVLKHSWEYLSIRSITNFSGWPFHPVDKNSKVSPRKGHPDLPGGRFLEERSGVCL